MLACSAFTAANAAPAKTPAKDDVPIVYFTKDISPAGLLKIYSKVSSDITGKVAVKIHTGEPHGPNILPVPMVKALQQSIRNSNLVETNTYYAGPRDNTKGHRETLKVNGWTFCKVDIMVATFRARRTLLLDGLTSIKKLSFSEPKGAFYVFLDVSGTGLRGEDFAKRLLEEKYVAVVPGIGFGENGRDYVRISFATSEEQIEKGLKRIREFVETL